MKKILCATTALVAFGVTSAHAADPAFKLELGGYMKQWVGAASNSNYKTSPAGGTYGTAAGVAKNPYSTVSDGMIYFKGSNKLEGGMTVGMFVAMNTYKTDNFASWSGNNGNTSALATNAGTGNLGAGHIWKEYAYISGQYGQLKVGQDSGVAKSMHSEAPDVGFGINGTKDWVAVPGSQVATGGAAGHHFQRLGSNSSGGYLIQTYNNDDSELDKIIYVSPQWNGFSIGYNYVPDITRAHGFTGISPSGRDVHSGVLAFAGTLAGVGIKADVGAQSENGTGASVTDQTTLQSYQGGLNLTYQGFTVGGGYMRMVQPSNRGFASSVNPGQQGYVTTGSAYTAASAIENRNGYGYDYGIKYETGPYAVSTSFGRMQSRGDLAYANKDKGLQYLTSFATQIGAGVALRTSAFYVNVKDQLGKNSAFSNRGYGAVTGIDLQF